MKEEKLSIIIIKKIFKVILYMIIILACILLQAIFMEDSDQARFTPLVIILALSFLSIGEVIRIIMIIYLILKENEKSCVFYNSDNVFFCKNSICFMKNFKIYKLSYCDINSLKKVSYTFEYPNNLFIKKYWKIYYCLFFKDKKSNNYSTFIDYEPRGIILAYPDKVNEQKIDEQVQYIIKKNNNIILEQNETIECNRIIKFLIKYSANKK